MDEIRGMIDEISSEKIKTYIKDLEGIRHPVHAPEALEKAANYVWVQLESFGYKMSFHHFTDDDKPFKNIMALHKGIQEPEIKVWVIAHFDTVPSSPGANDNASGVAAMLEVARVFRKFSFRKSIQFVGLNLEEKREEGKRASPICRGSRALANHARESGWEIEGIVNFEEIAYAGDDIPQSTLKNIPIEAPEVGNFIAVVGNEKSAGMVEGTIQAIEKYKIPLPYFPMVVPGNGEVFSDSRRSDHAPFWDNNYQAIMLTDTANLRTPHYHKDSDTLETLNIDFATEVCRAGAVLVYEMAGRI